MYLSATNFFEPESLASFTVTMIAVFINLVIMYVVVKRFLYKPVRRLLDERQARIAEEKARAERIAEEAASVLAARQAEHSEAKTEIAHTLSEARIRAVKEHDELIARAQLEADKILQTAAEHSMELRLTVLQHLRGDIARLVKETSEAVLGDIVTDEANEAKIEAELTKRMQSIMEQSTAAEHAASTGSMSHHA